MERKTVLKTERIVDIYDEFIDANSDLMIFRLSDDFIIDKNDLWAMCYTYGERRFPYYGLENIDNEAFFQFSSTWNHYCNENRDNWLKMWNALKVEYAPLDNYNMTESERTHHDGDDVSDREIHMARQEGTISPTEVRQYATTYEKTDGSLTGYTTQAVDMNSADNGTDTTTYTTADVERTLTRKGNIGVTTSQQMLQSELDLRKFNLKYEIIEGFINEYTYMGGC